ncbi:uncharacterized protein BX664DRAFT_294266 [Halteromyces radiatus]|uniref:uncharacterized protein n=1 Tax=Halteromyces radiatus TaxID=101107 RepID=UPI002220C227|nr:uncharacterized protein BX664DRAFT_294266 [Halteromyces radiatus]KAI8092895.1 hypothetical protein BX664DRAFT_294266 [Halteromyces radiatus]
MYLVRILSAARYFVLALFFQQAFTSALSTKQQSLEELNPTFRTSKNILFACTVGGSTHANWVLAILNELETRGHNVTFATRDDHSRFGKKYGIDTISVGPPTVPKQHIIFEDNKHLDPNTVMGTLIGHIADAYSSEYNAFKELIKTRQINLVICDHFVDSCIEAARFHNLPFVITSTLAIAPDARASFIGSGISLYGVHNNQLSLFERIHHNYLFTASFLWRNFNTLMNVAKIKKDLGIVASADTMASWRNSLKLVNTAFGLENARPLGPLVEFIGPILPQHYQSLKNTPYETFLDRHNRVIYVAFGQNAIPSLLDRQLIWSSLLSLLDVGDIDGVIWADGFADKVSQHSKYITLQQKEYTLLDIKSRSDVFISSWAPQMAILQHSSTAVFLTHGGAGSLYESLYAAVPMAVFPFVGDQLGAARNMEDQGLGVRLDRDDTVSNTAALLRTLVDNTQDNSNLGYKIRNNVKRYSALIQIHSQHAVQRGADLIEEVVFAGVSHRFEASRNMTFFKVYNLDIYLLFASIVMVCLWIGRWIIQQLYRRMVQRSAGGNIKSKLQ